MDPRTDRRAFLGRTLLGVAGVGAVSSLEGQTPRKEPPPPKHVLPTGKIGNVSVTRLFLGGNLIGGWAHSRDLIYVSDLFRAYNTEAKVLETLARAEQCGINTILIDPRCCEPVMKYRKLGGRIQTMVCISPDVDPRKTNDEIKSLVDKGANLLYTHGEVSDRHTHTGRLDVLGKAMDLIKAQGIPAGIGSHSLQTPIACEKERINADYYVKTFHHDRYWSATPREKREEWCWYNGYQADHDKFHDNIWCLDPEKTSAFMATVDKPWVAFKVMAAGAIRPRHAFDFAYRNGADFIVAGMFDFQIEEDVAIAADVLGNLGERARRWHG